MNADRQLPPYKHQPPLYLVILHSDYSGSKVFESRAEAVEYARDCSDSMRQQVGVYFCEFDCAAVPIRAELVVRP